MNAWQRESFKYLPQYEELIEQADTITFLLSELWFEFQNAYREEPKDECLIASIYEYAAWCWHGSDFQGNTIDLITAVFGCFYEPLPTDPVIRQDMPRWLCLKEFEILQVGPFTYFLNPDEHRQMITKFRKTSAKAAFPKPERCGKLALQ